MKLIDTFKWEALTFKQKKRKVITWVILLIFIVGVILSMIFSSDIYGEKSVFNKHISDNVMIQNFYQSVPAVILSVQIAVISVVLTRTLKLITHLTLTRSKRGLTIVRLIDSFIKYLIAIIAILLVLAAWGVDTAAIVASAGVLGLVIGLGAQSLIADIIAGVFIVFEEEYEVGDIVVIDNWRGTVQEIGIRTTKIIDVGGNLKVINNSQITTIINQTKELSLATCVMSIEYRENIETVEKVIGDNLKKIKKSIPSIAEGPFYKGVKALTGYSVDLLFIAKCKEEDIYQTQRDMNRELKILFDKHKISIPFNQIVVHHPAKKSARSDKKDIEETTIFDSWSKKQSENSEEHD